MEFVIHWHGIHVLIYDFPKVAKNDESVISRQEEAVSNEMVSVQLKKLKLISVSKTENSSVDKDEEQIIDIPLLYDKISIEKMKTKEINEKKEKKDFFHRVIEYIELCFMMIAMLITKEFE